MKIDPKDLILLELKGLLPGTIFYRKETDDDFAMCTAPSKSELEKMTEHEKWSYRTATTKYHSEGRLFVNRNKPGKNFLN